MGQILLVRHGQASFGADNYDQLSDTGNRQSRLLGAHFRERGLRFDRVLLGSMQRHAQTLEAALPEAASSAEVVPELNEYDFHGLVACYLEQYADVERPARGDARAFYRVLRLALGAWADGSLRDGVPESWAGFQQRIRRALGAMTADPRAGQVLGVSSGGAICAVIREVLGLTVEQMIMLNLQMANTGVSRMIFKGDKVRLQSWNGVPHLDHPDTEELISYT
ncbi:MAG: histidine phosphatase family protein [Ectothiorhodospiraceae bacterium]|nr:histidine phosphatase family protein [Ectothiorhodospiraceae bacterium]